jgi:hypothetical protein
MGKREIIRTSLGLAIASALFLAPSAPRGAQAAAPAGPAVSLIYAGWFGNTIPTPGFIRANQGFLESQPFQGIVAYLRNDATGQNATTGIMGGGRMSADAIAGILSPLKGLSWTTLVDNFGLVQGSTPPDFFDDWSSVIGNFADLAGALKDAGLRGICFDNEQYAAPWGDYPAGARYPTKSLSDYQTQARLRGSQVMQAMAARFPDIAVITLHGPYISELKAPASLGFPQWQSGNNLMGPFFAGFVDGAGDTASSVDGGELYTLRSDSDFMNSYTWRKYTLPSASVDCPFIPPALRAVWPNRVSISFGVYDRPFGGAPMDPGTLATTLTNALRHADRYVWFYTEGSTFLLPSSSGGASAAWVGSVRQAVSTVPASSAPSAPSAPADLVALAPTPSGADLTWTNPSGGVTGLEVQRKTGDSGSYQTVAQLGGGSAGYHDSGLSADTTYVYRVRASNGALESSFSNESSVTTAAAPPPSDGSSGVGAPTGSDSPSSPSGDPAAPAPVSGKSGGGSCGLLGIEGLFLVLPVIAGTRRVRGLRRD